MIKKSWNLKLFKECGVTYSADICGGLQSRVCGDVFSHHWTEDMETAT